MRICGLTRLTLAHGAKDGLEVHVKTLSEGLAQHGHNVTVVTTPHPNGVDVNRFRSLEEEGEAARRKAELALSSERMLRDALRVLESVTHVGD